MDRFRRAHTLLAGMSMIAVVIYLSLATTPVPPTAQSPPPNAGVRYGWELTAANTGLAGAGIDKGTLPTFDGAISSGMTLSKVRITTGVDLSDRSGVTLDRVWLQPTGGMAALVLGRGTVIKDSEIDGSLMSGGERRGITTDAASDYSIQRVYVHDVSIGAWLGGRGAGTMTDTFLNANAAPAGTHADGFTRRAGVGALDIVRCRIDAARTGSTTGAFFLQNTWGGKIAGITLQDTLLGGDGYNLTLEDNGPGTSLGANNVRVRPVGYGPLTAMGPVKTTQWNDVFLYDPAAPDKAGAAVPGP